jgi:AraC-like DNA-binding protein
MNWHERLEIFVPVSGIGEFRMGDRLISFSAGDVLVVDNLKLHGLADFRGRERRAMTITFNSELIYNLGSPLSDFLYLIPFHCQSAAVCPVVRCGDSLSPAIHGAIKRLVRCYFDSSLGSYAHAGCKAYLLELLFHLSRHFEGAEVAQSEYLKQQERCRRLGRLLDYLQQHYTRKLSIQDAASMVGMSSSRFMKFFKQATGTTFVSYVTHVRLAHACDLLRGTDWPISEVAHRVGIPDQAYFDRRFKKHFNISPRNLRAQASSSVKEQ